MDAIQDYRKMKINTRKTAKVLLLLVVMMMMMMMMMMIMMMAMMMMKACSRLSRSLLRVTLSAGVGKGCPSEPRS